MAHSDVQQAELRLLLRARQGEHDAFRELFEQFRDVVYRVARRITGHHEDALDVMQDSFVKAFGSLDALQDDARFRPWLLSIAHNHALDRLRSRRVRVAQSLDNPGTLHEVADRRDDHPEQALGSSELLERFEQALESLPPGQRGVMALYVQGELTYGEIAEIVGIPIGTVMSRIHHARLRIKAQLAGADE